MSAAAGGRQGSGGSVELVAGADRSQLFLEGEVDARLNSDLARAFAAAARRGVRADVDLRGTTFVDSTVIAAIAHLSRTLPAGVNVIDPPDHVRFLLEVSQVEDLVTITGPDPLEAAAAVEVPDLAVEAVERLRTPAVPELPDVARGPVEPAGLIADAEQTEQVTPKAG